MSVKFNYIGTIYTPHDSNVGVPVQPIYANGIKGKIVLNEEYLDGISDLEGFSHITILFHLHKSNTYKLKVIPFLDDVFRGVFSTRAPKRPNAIGLSTVKLNSINGNVLEIENVDILNGTPLLDIKPYIPEFDYHEGTKLGWYANKKNNISSRTSDNRFA